MRGRAVHRESRGILTPGRATADSPVNASGLFQSLPTVRRQAEVVLRHLDGVAVGQRHPEHRPNAGLPHIQDLGVVDLAGGLVAVTEKPAGEPVLQIELGSVGVVRKLVPRGALDP